MKYIVFSVREDEEPAIRAWEERNNIDVTTVIDHLTLDTIELVNGFDGLILQQRINLTDEKIYEKLQSFGIKQISLRTAGYDIVDIPLAKKYDLKVTNVPAYSPRSVAELALMQVMRLIRNNPIAEAQMSKGDFRWEGLVAKEIHTLTIGIIGAGRIGGTAAKLFDALGAKVIAYDPVRRDELLDILEYKNSQSEVLQEADVVSLHVPLDESTFNLFDQTVFEQMKSSAYLVNASRGPVVNTEDLIHALDTKQIAGVALDTITNEEKFFNFDFTGKELPDEKLSTLMSKDNVLITPHIGFYTEEAVQNMVDISLNSVLSILETGSSSNEVY